MTVRLTIASPDASTNFVRWSITSAPEGSALRKKLDASEKTQSKVHDGDLAQPYELKLDIGGRYTFLVEEFERGAAPNGGGWKGAPQSAQSETKLDETSLVLEVGQKLECTLGVNQDTAKLRLYVFGDYVRATTVAVHDEATPAVVNPTTQKARNVAEASYVVDEVEALADVEAADITGSIATVFADLRSTIDGHLGNAVAHNGADSYNLAGAGYGASSPAAAGASIDALRRKLESHMANTDATGPSGGYHDNPDNAARFAAAGAGSSRLNQMIALADLWRVYESHRGHAAPGIAIHNSVDATNVPDDLPPLMEIHRLFISGLESTTINTPSTTNEAAAYLTQQAGFTVA
jgi:hypothetical protein